MIDSGIIRAEGLAVDWITGTVYREGEMEEGGRDKKGVSGCYRVSESDGCIDVWMDGE